MTTEHAVTMNGRISTELKPRPGRSIHEELISRLALLDGKERFALWLWRLPAGIPFDRVDLESWPTELIQCAGGVGGQFTCEVRRLETNGALRHDVVGRTPLEHGAAERTESIRWGEHRTTVQQNEVLDLDEVGDTFGAYLVSGEIPARYVTRPLVFDGA